MLTNNSTFIGLSNDIKNSDIVLFGAPFDGTTSFRPGTRFGPTAIRTDSFGIETYSPYLDKDLEDINACDAGDLDLPFGNTSKALDSIEAFVLKIVSENKIPFMIGGEHLVSLPSVKSVFQKYNDLVILHFDAHTDLRDNYLGETLSHATVMKRIWDIVGDNKIYQFGIRSGTKDEFVWAKQHVNINKYDCKKLTEALPLIKNSPVYVSIDLDVLDPSIFAGTGTPEAGGISFKELLKSIHTLKDLNIVGADVVELSPHYDNSGVSTAVACKIIRELLLTLKDTN